MLFRSAELAQTFASLGEERHARRVARAIVAARRQGPIRRTLELAEIVRRVVPRAKDGIDPATRTFQALRLRVNDELGELGRGLAALIGDASADIARPDAPRASQRKVPIEFLRPNPRNPRKQFDEALDLVLNAKSEPVNRSAFDRRFDELVQKIYRIDVDKRAGNLRPNPDEAVAKDERGEARYSVPADNPFLGATSHRGQPVEPKTVRTEVWATGLRNPWRFSFDPQTGTCFAGDVGQNLFEEIDILVSGGDYGWSEIEGLHIYNRKDPSAKQGPAALAPASKQWIAPIYEYDRKLGNSVTGGVVYRGEVLPELKGAYVFGDYASGRIIALREKGGKWDGQVIAKDMTIAGFGYDPANGDVLFAAMSGQIKRLTKK